MFRHLYPRSINENAKEYDAMTDQWFLSQPILNESTGPKDIITLQDQCVAFLYNAKRKTQYWAMEYIWFVSKNGKEVVTLDLDDQDVNFKKLNKKDMDHCLKHQGMKLLTKQGFPGNL